MIELLQNNQNNNTPDINQQLDQLRVQYESQIDELEKKFKQDKEQL